MSRAPLRQHGTEAGSDQTAPTGMVTDGVAPDELTEEREVTQSVRDRIPDDRTLEELASDLRALSGQIMTARVMGLDDRPDSAAPPEDDAAGSGGRVLAPAARMVGDMLSAELGRTLGPTLERTMEQAGARQREELASLLLNHTQGMRATADRVDRLMRRLETDREREELLGRALIDRLDALAVRQEELQALLRHQRRSLVPDWVAGLLALAAVGISIGSALALHFGIQP
ncbi:hypothetical protein JL100_023820 [Skermanella mucosa]|uniref:hypothetical protein n=1 Tax=Skermanella mucosa TaxID=1789672 RepID=UPI00192BFAE3|nr:hypothetical protein [Skermanella mucosa]UEM20075.1 hypothetical protein JL100_023820 [Skermanella mucosa]